MSTRIGLGMMIVMTSGIIAFSCHPNDTTVPAVFFITHLSGDTLVAGETLAVAVRADDAGTGVNRVVFSVNSVVEDTETTAKGDTFMWRWVVPGEGSYRVMAQAFDKSGNCGSDSFDCLVPAELYPDSVIALLDLPSGYLVRGICPAPDGQHVYVTGNFSAPDSSLMVVVRTSDNTITDWIPLSYDAQSLCASQNGDYIYAANGNGTISKISTADNREMSSLVLPGFLTGEDICLLPGGAYLYACGLRSDSVGGAVAVIGTANDSVVARMNLRTPAYGLCASPDGRYVYVVGMTAFGEESVAVVRTSDNSLVTTIGLGASGTASGIGADPDSPYVYVAQGDDEVAIVRTPDNTVSGYYAVPGSPPTIPRYLTVLPGGRYIYLSTSHPAGSHIRVITTATGRARLLPVTSPATRLCPLPDGSRVYFIAESGSIGALGD